MSEERDALDSDNEEDVAVAEIVIDDDNDKDSLVDCTATDDRLPTAQVLSKTIDDLCQLSRSQQTSDPAKNDRPRNTTTATSVASILGLRSGRSVAASQQAMPGVPSLHQPLNSAVLLSSTRYEMLRQWMFGHETSRVIPTATEKDTSRSSVDVFTAGTPQQALLVIRALLVPSLSLGETQEGSCVSAMAWQIAHHVVAWASKSTTSTSIPSSKKKKIPLSMWSNLELQTCLADVQSFLQQTLAKWLWEERNPHRVSTMVSIGTSTNQLPDAAGKDETVPMNVTDNDNNTGMTMQTPYQWILRLMETVLEPLYHTDDCSSTSPCCSLVNETAWNMALELLVPSILALSREVMDDHLLPDCLDRIFVPTTTSKRCVRADRLLPWVNLAVEVKDLVRPQDWEVIRQRLDQALGSPRQSNPQQQQQQQQQQQKQQQQQQQQAKCYWPVRQDLPGLAQRILSLSLSVTSNMNLHGTLVENSLIKADEETMEWQKLLLRLLNFASSPLSPAKSFSEEAHIKEAVACMNTLSTIETVLLSRLSSSSSISYSALFAWTQRLVTAVDQMEDCSLSGSCPNFVRCNLLLLVERASRRLSRSQLVSRMVTKAFGGENGDGRRKLRQSLSEIHSDSLGDFCWQSTVKMMLPISIDSRTRHRERGRKGSDNRNPSNSHSSYLDQIQKGFANVSYQGRGRFQVETATDGAATDVFKFVDLISDTGSCVWRSLFLLDSPSRNDWRELTEDVSPQQQLQALERAQAWVQAALDGVGQLRSRNEAVGSRLLELTCTTVILITVYNEIPHARSFLVRVLKQTFGVGKEASTASPELIRVYCLLITVVLRSGTIDGTGAELEGLSSILQEERIPFDLFSELALALAPLTSARRCLLDTTEKRLGKGAGSRFMSIVAAGLTRTSTDTDRIKSSIFSLVALITTSTKWGSLETEAWANLSDIIVLSKPTLPLEIRRWMFSLIRQRIKDARTSNLTKQHFLRACLCRMLNFFGPSNGRDCFLPQNCFVVWSSPNQPKRSVQIEDVVGLFELVVEVVDAGNNRDESNILASWQEYFRELVQDQFSITNSNERRFLRRGHPPIKKEQGLHVHASLYCCLMLFRYYSEGISDRVNGTIAPSCLEIRSMLVEEERSSLGSAATTPCWLQVERHIIRSTISELQVLDGDFAETVSESLYHALISFSVNSGLFDVDGSERASKQLCLGLASTYVFMKRRQHLSDSDRPSDQPQEWLRQVMWFPVFCDHTVPVIEQCILNESDVAEVENLIKAVLASAETLVARPELVFPMVPDLTSKLTTSVWQLYMALCEESAATRLISYLENASESKKELSFGSIGTPKLVDQTVRNVRTEILKAFRHCVRSLQLELNFEKLDFLSETVQEQRRAALMTILVDCIDVLSQDVASGVLGASGGMTHELFLLFLNGIEECSECLRRGLVENDSSILRKTISTATKAEDSIKKIVTSFTLKGSEVLKRSLFLVLYNLPSLTKVARYQLLCRMNFAMQASQENESLSSRFLLQCVAILDRKTTLSTDTPWEEIAGPEHFADFSAEEQESSEDDDETTHMNASICSRMAGRGISSCPTSDYLQLFSERAWNWALLTILKSTEMTWQDCLESMREPEPETFSGDAGRKYVKARSAELSDILVQIHSTLDFSDDHQLHLRSMYLPQAAKFRLASTLDSVLVTLQKAIRCISTKIRRPGPNDQSHTFDVLEALSCLSAWFDCHGVVSENLVAAMARWYAAEMNVVEAPSSSSSGRADDAFVRKISRTAIRAEELLSSLQKFDKELTNLKQQPESTKGRKAQKVLLEIESLRGGSVDLRLTVHDIVNSIEKSLSTDSEEEAGRKRRASADISLRVRKARRKRNIRSRNQLVDSWLQMDQTIGRDEPVEDDAYADLEDFLVGG